MGRFRFWLIVGSVVLITLEAASVLYLVPVTAFTVGLEEAYHAIALDRVTIGVTIGGLVSLFIVVVAVFLGDLASRWAATNAIALAFGTVTTIFLAVDVFVSFAYLPLDDLYPGGFTDGPNWAAVFNVAGPLVLFGWLVSVTIRFAFSPAWTLPALEASEAAVEPVEARQR